MSGAMDEGRLAGKVALIAGGAGAFGESIARRYLAEGATVVISGQNELELKAGREALADAPGADAARLQSMIFAGRDLAAARAAVAEVAGRLGRIDLLVAGPIAGGPRQRLADMVSPERAADMIGGVWGLARIVAPHMPPGGSIITVAPLPGDVDGNLTAAATYAALEALSQGLARELAPRGLRVNTIAVGQVEPVAAGVSAAPTEVRRGMSAGGMTVQVANGRATALADLAGTALFLAGDDSAALNGDIIEVGSGEARRGESRTTFTSRPDLRAADGSGRVTLICAGDQIEDVLALTGLLRACGGEAVIGLRSKRAIAQIEHTLAESTRIQGATYTPPILVYLNPLEPESVDEALSWIGESLGAPNAAIILPARGESLPPTLAGADDTAVARFLEDEVSGTIALAAQLSRFWQGATVAPGATVFEPRVIFLSNGDDGRGNLYASIRRAVVEQLVRVWRREARSEQGRRAAGNGAGSRMLPPVWANQIVRYSNAEDESLEFACVWTTRLIYSGRHIDEANLYLPAQIAETTGARGPSLGWAESLVGLHLGKTALITGGSAGIGGQVGRLLALSGARVMLAARDKHKLEQMRTTILRELEDVGYTDPESRVQIAPGCDVASEAELIDLVDRATRAFGNVDYLINNAGIAGVEEMVVDLPLSGWRHTLNANLISNYSLIRKLAPQMKAQGSGYILNVSSYFGGEKDAAIPYPNRADYAVSKAGQRAMAEALARFLGPEVQINALAPGPVEGDRLRGTGERPGLFMRRARLILENRRLSDLHAAVIEAHRASGTPVDELVEYLRPNSVRALAESKAPLPLRDLAARIVQEGDSHASASSYLMTTKIADKLLARFVAGGYMQLPPIFPAPASLAVQPPEPFFARTQIEREARKVRDGIMSMLYLQRMPTEFDVAMATVYYLADRNVSGETFHPSGGLRYERTPTGAELFGQPSAERLAQLVGSTVFLIGEHLAEHLEMLARAYLERNGVRQVVLLTETEAGAEALSARLADHAEAGRLHIIVAGDDIESALDTAVAEHGRPGPVVCTPFRALPAGPLVGRKDSDWSTVLNEEGFTELCEQQLTHHFRVTHKVSLMDGAALALVTPETTANSTTEQFALANFVKTTLHAFTATVGVESERTVHRVLVNQVDLTRRARSEEPRSEAERRQELDRFVDAILLTTAPMPAEEESRYTGRIHRGRAITV